MDTYAPLPNTSSIKPLAVLVIKGNIKLISLISDRLSYRSICKRYRRRFPPGLVI